jgi:hypothetical protein
MPERGRANAGLAESLVAPLASSLQLPYAGAVALLGRHRLYVVASDLVIAGHDRELL